MQPVTKVDPIKTNYFDIIEKVDFVSKILFFIGAALSIASAVVQENEHRELFHAIQSSFLVVVVVMFAFDLSIKLYLAPRAADARAQDFLSHAYQEALTTDRTEGYYNNGQANGIPRLAAQAFENTLFTKEVCRHMFKAEAPIAGLYLVAWLVALAYGQLPTSLLAALAQLIFSEQIVARLGRLWWLRQRCESIHEEFRRLYLSKATGASFDAAALDSYTRYEVAKATAAITLSSTVFNKLNKALSAQWDQLRTTLSIT